MVVPWFSCTSAYCGVELVPQPIRPLSACASVPAVPGFSRPIVFQVASRILCWRCRTGLFLSATLPPFLSIGTLPLPGQSPIGVLRRRSRSSGFFMPVRSYCSFSVKLCRNHSWKCVRFSSALLSKIRPLPEFEPFPFVFL